MLLQFAKRIKTCFYHYAPYTQKYRKMSYSQSGEDLIVKFIFDSIGINKPSYIDIGAHHPQYLSNTAIFYRNGSRGINIEPDPILFQKFVNGRKYDINLNIGIADIVGEIDFYLMSNPALNTFSESEANKYAEIGYSITSNRKIRVDKLSNIIEKYQNNNFPDFLSLDVEGMDEIVLKSINYEEIYPIVICVETMTFSQKGDGLKNKSIIEFLEGNGYLVYADTYLNTIFVRRDRWLVDKHK